MAQISRLIFPDRCHNWRRDKERRSRCADDKHGYPRGQYVLSESPSFQLIEQPRNPI